MPLVPGSLLHRYRVDPRAARRDEIGRLEALGVVMSDISPARARSLLTRFVAEFVDPSCGADLTAELMRPGSAERTFDMDRWLRPDCTRRGGSREGTGCVRWLRMGLEGGRCFRFERRPHLPALSIDLDTMDDTWAASWPGVFVRFDVGRVVVITIDYEEIRCDVRAGRGTPYR